MKSVYFVQEEITGFWLCHGRPPGGFPKEGKFYLEPLSNLKEFSRSRSPVTQRLVYSFDPDEALHHLQEASQLILLQWHPGDKKIRAQLKLKKLTCSVYPPQVTTVGIPGLPNYKFIHADKGPFTYYVIPGLYRLRKKLFGYRLRKKLFGGSTGSTGSTGFGSYTEAKKVFDRVVGKQSLKDGWRIEKRQGFIARGANPRMTSLFGGEEPWYQSDFVLHVESIGT